MKILITGGRGMLGRTLQQELIEHELVIADLPETDITHPADFDRLMAAAAPAAPRPTTTTSASRSNFGASFA